MTELGVTYDTGFLPGGSNSRPRFRRVDVERDMQAIADKLGCRSVRITGGSPKRLAIAADEAVRAGLRVLFSPFPCELSKTDTTAMLVECAGHAELLRRAGADVTLVLGCELSLFGYGFVPGANFVERMPRLGRPIPALAPYLAEVARSVRPLFGGPLTYASGTWEDIDWTPFDIVSVDAYRDHHNAHRYAQKLAALRVSERTLAVTEFGCCTYRGAGELGGAGWMTPPEDVVHLYDENEQVQYLRDCDAALEQAGVDIAFWFTYASWTSDPERAYGLTRITAAGPVPKRVFGELAARTTARV